MIVYVTFMGNYFSDFDMWAYPLKEVSFKNDQFCHLDCRYERVLGRRFPIMLSA